VKRKSSQPKQKVVHSKSAGLRFAVDIGGTFTDLVLLDEAGRRLYVGKTLTTPGKPDAAVLEGLKALAEREGIDLGNVQSCIHATTLITNALIERRGAKVGQIGRASCRERV